MRAVRCLIFDLDGTLVDLPVNYSRLKRRLGELLHMEVRLTTLIPAIREAAAGGGEVFKRALEIIDEEELDALKGMSEMAGAKGAVVNLKRRGYRVALVTLQGVKAARLILHRISLADVFETVVTREDGQDRAGQIRLALKRLKLEPEEVVMVGDRANDVESAKEVGCRVILVRRSWSPHPDAERTVTSVMEIEEVLQAGC